MSPAPGKKLIQLFSTEQISAAVARIASDMNRDYVGKNPLVIGVLKGCFIFLADLVRHLDFPVEVDFITLSSYGSGTQTSGNVCAISRVRTPIAGRDLIVVEDIVDSGVTLDFLLNSLRRKKPSSLRVCALLDKSSRRRVPVQIDYKGLDVPDKFLVGYGLDCDQQFRQLAGLWEIAEGCEE